MLSRILAFVRSYPRQFWLMVIGMLISTIGSSMIWPFLMIYVNEKLQLPMTSTASLMTLNSLVALGVSLVGGPVVDRLGRKWVMAVSLILNGVAYFFMSYATTLPQFAVLMGLQGAFNPLFRTASDAMMADLVGPERRSDAYSVLRTSNNAGIALGPTIGGWAAMTSYSLAFYGAAVGLATYGILIALFFRETLARVAPEAQVKERFGGYDRVFSDRHFILFVVGTTMVTVCSSLVWVLMSVYAKENYGLPENLYGLIAATNAVMVVSLQYVTTQITKRHRPLAMAALGGGIYTLAVGSVALATGFWGFWGSMVFMTIGELILVPTATTYAANLAPADMRGRYMGLYGLSWNIATGLGPLYGGVLNDNLGPRFIWLGGSVIGAMGVMLYLLLGRRGARREDPAYAGQA